MRSFAILPFSDANTSSPRLVIAIFPFSHTVVIARPGRADLCAFFFRRADILTSQEGVAGLVATNTIAQGDTQMLALGPLAANGGRIYRASSGVKWPGLAAVSVNVIHWSKTRFPA